MTTLMQAATETTSNPSIKLRNVGDSVLLAVTDYAELEANDIDGNPKFTSRGDRATDIVVTGLVVHSNNAKVRSDGEDIDVDEGDEVSVWFTGSRWFQWLQAAKRLGTSLDVGDMLSVKFDQTEKPANPAHSPKAIWAINWGKATKPELISWSDKANEARRVKKTETLSPAVIEPSAPVEDFDGF